MKKLLFLLFLIASAVAINAQIVIPDEQESTPALHTIVGDDDREDITNNAQNLEKAVVLLKIISNDGIGFCSGAMVGPKVVLTAAHCFVHNGEYAEYVEVFAYAANNNSSSSDQNENTQKITLNLQDIHDTHKITGAIQEQTQQILAAKETQESENTTPLFTRAINLYAPDEYIELSRNNDYNGKMMEHDYGIVVLNKPIGLDTGWYKLKSLNTAQLKSAKIFVYGRPADKPVTTLWKSPGSISFWDVYIRTFKHNADTLSGNSGGPIVLQKNPDEIIGINVSGKKEDQVSEGYPNGGLRINKKIINLVQEENRKAGTYLTAAD